MEEGENQENLVPVSPRNYEILEVDNDNDDGRSCESENIPSCSLGNVPSKKISAPIAKRPMKRCNEQIPRHTIPKKIELLKL